MPDTTETTEFVTTLSLREIGQRAIDIIENTGWTQCSMYGELDTLSVNWEKPNEDEAQLVREVCKTGTHCAFGALAVAVLPDDLDPLLTSPARWSAFADVTIDPLRAAFLRHDSRNPLGQVGYDFNDDMDTTRDDVIDKLRDLPDAPVTLKWRIDDEFRIEAAGEGLDWGEDVESSDVGREYIDDYYDYTGDV